MVFARKTSWGRQRGRHHVGVVNLRRIAGTLDMSLSELFAEVEGKQRREGGG
jgi:hypothetical protein